MQLAKILLKFEVCENAKMKKLFNILLFLSSSISKEHKSNDAVVKIFLSIRFFRNIFLGAHKSNSPMHSSTSFCPYEFPVVLGV